MTIDTQQYDLERLDPDCLDPLEAAELLRDAPWQRLVVLGDSVAAGVREPLAGYRDAGFTDRLGETLASTRPGFVYRNLGCATSRSPRSTRHSCRRRSPSSRIWPS